jgi:hypothetical protein
LYADILASAERILPRASDLWVQASLDYKQRLQQQLFFPEGVAFDGNRFNRTAAPQRHHFSSSWRRIRVLKKFGGEVAFAPRATARQHRDA